MNEKRAVFKQFINSLLLVVFWVLIFLNNPLLCHSDGHSHHKPDEHPSFKYSKAANQLHSGSSPQHAGHSAESEFLGIKDFEKNSWTLWITALTSTLIISAAPFFILFFVSVDRSKEKEPLLKILLSFASGGLLGDAFLHLIPHALSPHSHDDEGDHHGHSHSEHHEDHGHNMGVGLSVLLGIVTFLLVEKSVRLVKGDHAHSHQVKKVKENEHEKVDHKGKKTDDNKKNNGKKGESKKKKEGREKDNEGELLKQLFNLSIQMMKHV